MFFAHWAAVLPFCCSRECCSVADDGESVALGGVASASLELATLSEMEDVSLAYLTTRLACTDSAAYVLESYGRGLTEYKAGAGAALGRDACGIGGSGAHETGVIPPAARLQQPVSGGRWTARRNDACLREDACVRG